jgi:hypothetical protein
MVSCSSRTSVRKWVSIAGMLFCAWAATGCGVEVGAEYPGTYAGDYPPDGYIATTEPVYFDGHPAYWWGNRWYYRDGGGWRHYDREPPALAERRMHAPPVRRTYARPEPRAPGRR